jgi:hypothetical protein
MKLLILISLFASSHVFASSVINCLTTSTARKYRTLCAKVIDPMKFKTGELSTTNCIGGLGDGYEVGICEHVNIDEQLRMKQDMLVKKNGVKPSQTHTEPSPLP